MASVVCQPLQSSLDPIESVVLTHKLSLKHTQSHQKPNLELNSVLDNNGERVNKTNGNGFCFFNVLQNPSSNLPKNEEIYVHPMVKRSASALSSMSLEMCTESLGTETGSDVSESSDEFSWEERERFEGLKRSKAQIFDRKMVSHRHGSSSRGSGFPPPLNSISGSDGTVKVRPHREGGRLVIKAVSVSDCGTKFEAERTNGRLKLSLLKDCCGNVETRRAEMKITKGDDEEEGCDGDVEEEGGGGRWWEMDGSRKQKSLLPKSFEESTSTSELGLSRCKDGRNGNKNWSLTFRVIIS